MTRNVDVVTLGETMALVSGQSIAPFQSNAAMLLGLGGSESNVAIALQRLGRRATWIGRLGGDSLGDMVERELRAEGVLAHVVRDPIAPTGLMLKEQRSSADTRIWYYRDGSAGAGLAPEDVAEGVVEAARVLHVTGITLALSESARAAVFHAVDRARAAGVVVSFDLNYRSSLWTPDEAAVQYRRLLPLADIVFGGLREAEILLGPGAAPAEAAIALAESGPSQSIVKLGGDGAIALIDGIVYEQVAPRVAVVDTVGAGDGFAAGYLCEVLAGARPVRRLDTATRVGSYACTVAGDWEGYPRYDDLARLEASDPVVR